MPALQSLTQFVLSGLMLTFLSFNTSHAQNWDVKLLRKMNHPPSADADRNWGSFSKNAYIVDVGMPLALITAGMLKHDPELRAKGILMGVSYVGNSIITGTLKKTFKRARPFESYPDLIYKKGEAGNYSFPSGHTSEAFSTATMLSLSFPKWYVVIPAYTYASAVGYSRMYLGVHYPSDVLAGALVGSGTAYLSWKINNTLRKKHKALK